MTNNTLYKFFALPKICKWDHYNIEYLKENILPCSHPIKFNDPFEGILFYRGTNQSQEDSIQSMKESAIKQLPDDKKWIFDCEDCFFINRYIVSCFTSCISDLMWAHYANNHYGFCVKYVIDDMFIGKNGDCDIINWSDKEEYFRNCKISWNTITYVDKPIVYDFSNNSSTTLSICNSLYNKSESWKEEKECRLVIEAPKSCGFDLNKFYGIKYNKKCIQAIYFGINMLKEYSDIIFDIVKSEHIKIYKSYIGQSSYEIQYKQINN